MIAELLSTGEENARTGKELAALLNCNLRELTAGIERERREGQPICANSKGKNSGYYLAADAEELEIYCRRLHHRAAELHKTRRILQGIAARLAENNVKWF